MFFLLVLEDVQIIQINLVLKNPLYDHILQNLVQIIQINLVLKNNKTYDKLKWVFK